ncbi:MAG: tRNA lysidine(34) synthetase TilS [Clostridia bacterium]|nr:tRNA lysidine(34) synthetase TilS [Clostridia bacterium]
MPRTADLVAKVREYIAAKGIGLKEPLVAGLSGGADSVCLLLVLQKLGVTPVCVHINHMIRGKEADRDEEFCRSLCEKLGVKFVSYKCNVPEYAKEKGIGTEEAAREMRWARFYEAARRCGAKTIAVAHNRTDRLETFLFNSSRGAGLRGLGSILPVREKDGFTVIRPLLCADKQEITAYLDSIGQPYVHDSTNDDTDYTRNYIRKELLPRFGRVNPAFASNMERSADAAAEADEFVESCALDYISSHERPDPVSFSSLHACVASRVLSILYNRQSGSELSFAHVGIITEFIKTAENGKRLNLPSGTDLIIENGVFRFAARTYNREYRYVLAPGLNRFADLGFDVYVEAADDAVSLCELKNIYKLVKRFIISSDIIRDGVYVRNRAGSDRLVYGGMTHTVKKLLSEKKVPSSRRGDYPVFCDKRGVLCIMPFVSRDGCRGDEKFSLTYCENSF